MNWIGKWKDIEPDATYLVCPINQRQGEDKLYLSGITEMNKGWAIKRLREGCYLALKIVLPSDGEIRQLVNRK